MSAHVSNLRRTRADMLGTDDEEHYWECHRAADRIEQLEALTEADGKEIGSYRKGTGLRGENRAMMDRIEQLEAENKENLNRYGRHTDDCRVSYRAGRRVKPCGCGLDAALENIDE